MSYFPRLSPRAGTCPLSALLLEKGILGQQSLCSLSKGGFHVSLVNADEKGSSFL